MKSVSIECSPRENTGKSSVKNLRKQGMVPCILYGGKDNITFSANVKDFKKIVYTPEVFKINLNIGGTEYPAIMKDLQFHPVTDEILHVDFMKLEEGKPVVVDIPVKLTGAPVGVKQGGKLHSKVRTLQVKAKPADLPDFIEINVEDLEIGKSVKVADVNIKGVEILNTPNTAIALVKVTRQVVEEPTAAPAAAPAAAGSEAPKEAPAAQ